MILKDGMLLYHGSYTAIETISLEKCTKGKDFGKGFYLTSDIGQAKNFIKMSIRKAQGFDLIDSAQDYGYITSFQYNEPAEGIKTHIFEVADKEWLWYVSQNRRKRLAELLAGRIDPSIDESDIIVGKIANDKTNPVTNRIGRTDNFKSSFRG